MRLLKTSRGHARSYRVILFGKELRRGRSLMGSSLKSFGEFDQLLASARADVDTMALAEPGDGAINAVKRQLDTLHGWTRGGRCPSQPEKDQLNFGMIASRELDNYPVADALYTLASFVIYWGEEGGAPKVVEA